MDDCICGIVVMFVAFEEPSTPLCRAIAVNIALVCECGSSSHPLAAALLRLDAAAVR
jgi:hypothetical protein